MTRKEAVNYLHTEKGYSRRLSAKITDLALSKDSSTMLQALRKALTKGSQKENKVVIRHYIKK